MTSLGKADRNLDIGVVFLRILVGASETYHGSQQLFGAFGGPGFSAALDRMSGSWRAHDLMGTMLVFGEFFGGVAILLGLLTQVAAAGLLSIMVGAWLTKLGASASYDFGRQEIEWLLLLGSAALIFTGPGAFAIDAYLPWRDRLRRLAPYLFVGSLVAITLIWLIFNKTNPLDAPTMRMH